MSPPKTKFVPAAIPTAPTAGPPITPTTAAAVPAPAQAATETPLTAMTEPETDSAVDELLGEANRPATDPFDQSTDQPDSGTDPSPRVTGRKSSGSRAAKSSPSGHYPGSVPRLKSRQDTDSLTTRQRSEWRHRLRASAGKLARAYEAVEEAAEAWEELVEEARTQGVPPTMVSVAMQDAGLPTE